MKLSALQENLRRVLRARIESGGLTGIRLAEQTGFQQAHISNFLNRKRSLSLNSMDKLLKAQKLSVLDLLDPEEINQRASIGPPSADDFENVFLVAGTTAAREPRIMNMNIRESLKFKKSFLRKLRPEADGKRHNWQRFVALLVDGRDGMSMYPRLLPGAVVLVDRHYNSLKPYRRNEFNMYAINQRGLCTIKYVEVAGESLVLRPENHAYPVEILPLEKGRTVTDYLIGRICHVSIET